MELDANNSGHIEYHDFINLMVKLGLFFHSFMFVFFFSFIHVSCSFFINTDKEPPTENEQLLRKWLGIFDKDNDGIIDNHELTQVLKTLGESLSQQEADAMIKTLDPSNSGRVHIDSAIKVLLSKA